MDAMATGSKSDMDDIRSYFGDDVADKIEDANKANQSLSPQITDTQQQQDKPVKSKKSFGLSKIVIAVFVIAIILIVGVVLYTNPYILRIGTTTAVSSSSGCDSSPGYTCILSSMGYNHTNNQISLIISQNASSSLYGVAIAYVPSGTPIVSGIPQVVFKQIPGLAEGILPSGKSVSVVLPASNASSVQVGTAISGTVWLAYSYSQSVSNCAGGSIGTIAANCQALRIGIVHIEAS